MKIDLDRVPVNLDEAIQIIKDGADEIDIAAIKDPTYCSSQMHFGFGMYLRNQWSLWKPETKLVKWFKKTYKIEHADDISGLILECFSNDIRGEPRKDKECAKRYIQHWKKYKI